MNYRISESIYLAVDTLQRAADLLRDKADSLEATGDMDYAIEAFGIIKNLHNNIHLDNWASSLKRDVESLG